MNFTQYGYQYYDAISADTLYSFGSMFRSLVVIIASILILFLLIRLIKRFLSV